VVVFACRFVQPPKWHFFFSGILFALVRYFGFLVPPNSPSNRLKPWDVSYARSGLFLGAFKPPLLPFFFAVSGFGDRVHPQEIVLFFVLTPFLSELYFPVEKPFFHPTDGGRPHSKRPNPYPFKWGCGVRPLVKGFTLWTLFFLNQFLSNTCWKCQTPGSSRILDSSPQNAFFFPLVRCLLRFFSQPSNQKSPPSQTKFFASQNWETFERGRVISRFCPPRRFNQVKLVIFPVYLSPKAPVLPERVG